MHDSQVRRILIVDNDEAVLLALERVLEGENYATATAVRSMLDLGASQKPRKITFPVMLATNT